MTHSILTAIGGLGLFLVGMLIMTEGLRALAGTAMRRLLPQFTKSPASGAVTGAVMTAVIQSSSATTVAAVGFVGAGLLTFNQSLGVIFGANIGTTLKGWVVALVGFELDLGAMLLPGVLIGVLLKMFAPPRLGQAGWALAGFSLLFVGLDAMQEGMAFFESRVTPANFPPDTLFGRLQLVLIGAAITLATQSSSAGVAAALVALHAGTISLPQAAAMVIGMDVGTTATAALASLGGSTAMRRTGFAHVVYNVMTGVMAFFLLSPYMWIVGPRVEQGAIGPELALVGFHTLFNTLGVLIILGFTAPFARFVMRIVPERGATLTSALDERLLEDSGAAVDALAGAAKKITEAVLGLAAGRLSTGAEARNRSANASAIAEAIETAQAYSGRIRSSADDDGAYLRHQAAFHVIDHLERLHERLSQSERIATAKRDATLATYAAKLRELAGAALKGAPPAEMAAAFDRFRQELKRLRREYRTRIVAAAARGEIDAETTEAKMDAVRWLHRSAYHLWRIMHHLAAMDAPAARAGRREQTEQTEPRLDVAND